MNDHQAETARQAEVMLAYARGESVVGVNKNHGQLYQMNPSLYWNWADFEYRLGRLISKEEFVATYLAGNPDTAERIKARMTPMPCNCAEPDCKGWAMISNTMVDDWQRQLDRRG